MTSWSFTLHGLTIESIIVMTALTLNLTENFGHLANSEQVQREVDGSALVGAYGSAVTAMSAVVVALTGLTLLTMVYHYLNQRSKSSVVNRQHKLWYGVLLISVLMGVTTAGCNLNLTENFFSIGDLAFYPNPPVAGENYKLRGVYGIATVSLNSVALGFSGLTYLGVYLPIFTGLWRSVKL